MSESEVETRICWVCTKAIPDVAYAVGMNGFRHLDCDGAGVAPPLPPESEQADESSEPEEETETRATPQEMYVDLLTPDSELPQFAGEFAEVLTLSELNEIAAKLAHLAETAAERDTEEQLRFASDQLLGALHILGMAFGAQTQTMILGLMQLYRQAANS